MEKDKSTELIAYCGLYCGDCAGFSGEIAGAARVLLDAMGRYGFERTAAALFADKFPDYAGLVSMLEFMSDTKCPAPCRERERKCAIAVCCTERGFPGCHECDEIRTCEKLAELAGLHGDACVVNLERIREMGPEEWIASGRRLWFGTAVDEPDESR